MSQSTCGKQVTQPACSRTLSMPMVSRVSVGCRYRTPSSTKEFERLFV